MSLRRRSGVLAVLVVPALVLAACGTGTDGDEGEPALDVLSDLSPDAGVSPVSPAQSPPEDVPSALEDPQAEGLPEPLIDLSRLLPGGPPPDGIPPVDDPRFDPADEVDWLDDVEPVLAVQVGGQQRAYPVQIMMWHEIVNDVVAGVPVAVTYCPLCNSALVFDRRLTGPDGQERLVSFGTSGLLYESGLVMYDRQTESLWSQLVGTAVAGTLTGVALERYPVQTVAFGLWRQQNPDGLVLNRQTGESRPYGSNPYEGYDSEATAPFLFDGPVDDRLPPTRRVVGVTSSDGDRAVAVDHALLAEEGVVPFVLDGRDVVAVWLPGPASALDTPTIAEGRTVGATGVIAPGGGGQDLTLAVERGVLRDEETGSTWTLDGEAVAGPLKGTSVDVVAHIDPFWFAWAAVHPDTELISQS